MDPSRRPPVPREPLPEDLNLFEPEEPFELDFDRFARNIRSARRKAAGEPSGMTAEHLRPLLENDRDIAKLRDFASIMAREDVPDRIDPAVQLGRITALQKPGGGERGIAVSDFLRRAVARTVAQRVSKEVEEATAPFQYALKTKSGCECVSHILQALTQSSPRCTIVSVDGVGAFDLVSRNAMLRGLMSLPSGGRLLPFVRTFCGQPSVFLWEDETGEVHHIQQGEGGEQGDPLMPLLVCLAQHPALVAANERLDAGEHLFAYLDDLYTSCEDPDRTAKPTVHWDRNSRDTRTFPSTMGRPRCGTVEVVSPQVVQHSTGLHVRWMKEEWCGEETQLCPLSNRASESWGHQKGTPTSSAISSGRNLMLTVACSNAFLQLVTCRPLGCSCCTVLPRSRISSCALCPLLSLQRMPRSMRCLSRVLGISAHAQCLRVPKFLPPFHFGKEDLDCGTCPECAQQPIGAVGQIACQWCTSVTLTSVGGLLDLEKTNSRTISGPPLRLTVVDLLDTMVAVAAHRPW